MKTLLSILLLLVVNTAGMSQPAASLASLSSVTIHLKADDLDVAPGFFSHFDVIDDRPDTARIGIHTFIPVIGGVRNRQLVLPGPAARTVGDYLNAHFTRPGASYSALVILRNLWLSDANVQHEDKVKDPDLTFNRTHIRLKAEIYARKDDQYIPILRYDTLQTYRRSNPYNNPESYYSIWDKELASILADMADSVAELATGKVANGRQLHLEDILRFNHSRFDAPINDTFPLRTGVYANFGEFRDNAPSIQQYEIKMEKKEYVLYLKDAGGRSFFSHDAWGYCDGRQIYIMWGGVLVPVWKEGKAFYFLGVAFKQYESRYPSNTLADLHQDHAWVPTPADPQNISPRQYGAGRLGEPLHPNGLLKQTIFTVDMDSGNAY
jgi:hypothetical protein